MNWTAEMEQTLRQSWASGNSAKEIAAMLALTPEAVRARAYWLGLPRHDFNKTIGGLYKGKTYTPPVFKAPPPLRAGPLSKPRPWEDRQLGECAFPLEIGGERLACCAPVKAGARRPYCEFHLNMTRRPCSPSESLSPSASVSARSVMRRI